MGIDKKRFVDNVNEEFICGICGGVFQEPIVIKECQHVFCANCIKGLMRGSSTCPKDHNLISFSHLMETQKLILNLLNQLKLKCEFNGCEEVIRLGDLDKHLKSCVHKQITKPIRCLCRKEFNQSKEMEEHKEKCLEFLKNEIQTNRSQISTFIADVFNECTQLTTGKKFNNETEYLYHRLSQSLPKRSRYQTSVQNILLYLNWRLLDHKPNVPIVENHEQLIKIRLGLRDLNKATICNKEAIRTFIRSNGLDYILQIHNLTKNRDIEQSITDFLVNFCEFENHLKHLMDRPILELILSLSNPRTKGMENSFNCVDILSHIIIKFDDKWNEISSSKERTEILTRIRVAIGDWKLNVKLRKYSSIKNQINRLKIFINKMPSEVLYRYIWVLVYHSRCDPKNHMPMIYEQKVKEILTPVVENPKTEGYVKDMIQLLFHQMDTFDKMGHLNGLENSDKRDFVVN